MRKLALSTIVAFAVFVTAAVAQSGGMGGSSQGTQGSSPTAQPGQTQPGQIHPGQPGGPDMGPGTAGTDQNGTSANTNESKGEKKLKGCVQSENGQYVLETKKGNILLTGQDVSAHVGHEVSVRVRGKAVREPVARVLRLRQPLRAHRTVLHGQRERSM